MRKDAARALWLALLTAAVLLVARDVWNGYTHLDEYAYGCDSWGYLQMAEDIRQGRREGRLPDFAMRHPQIDLLVDFLRSIEPKARHWSQFVAPPCYHYFERADHVATQYPPGAALMLSAFPKGDAVNGLNRTTITLVTALALAAMLGVARLRAPLAAGAVAAAAIVTLQVLSFMGHGNYSAHAMPVPGALGVALLLVCRQADRRRRVWAAPMAAFAAGLALGWFCVIRIASVLLLPACALLIDRRRWPPLAAGGFLAAFPILAWHQSAVAGAWWATTYGGGDQRLASLERALEACVPYYLGGGAGSHWQLDMLVVAVGFLGVALLSRARGAGAGLRGRLALAAGIAWILQVGFFVSHWVTARYYLAPLMVIVVWMLALGALIVERDTGDRERERARLPSRRRRLFVLAALVPGLFALSEGFRARASEPRYEQRKPSLEVPAELLEPRAWIWSMPTSGSFWYYAARPAFKSIFARPELRARVWGWAAERGDPQFLILDNETNRVQIAGEAEALGALLVPRGEVFGKPYVRMDWPAEP